MTEAQPSPYLSKKEALEKSLGPIVFTFTMNQPPAGGAPEWVKRDWLNLSLPVRDGLLQDHTGTRDYVDLLTGEQRHNQHPIPVYGDDALEVLRGAGRLAAADYWGVQGFEIATFLFRAHEGELVEVAPPHENH